MSTYQVNIMNPFVLAGLLKRAYPDFNMISFDNRLKVQKFVYLLQEWGLNLGYRFSLYLRGPYCTEVAKDAFQMPDSRAVPLQMFAEAGVEKRFNEFLSVFAPHKNSVDWLEVASSILIFKRLYTGQSKEQIVEKVLHKNENVTYSTAFIERVWENLRTEWGMHNA
jgi:uncharacterized protein YwgA